MDKREKVARAIAESQEFWWDDLEQSQKDDFKRDADAAIAALEPVRICAKCGHPENNHSYRHPFVGV